MDKPLINILTRTSNRPNAFDLNYNVIKSQTYKNIRHIVSVDDEITKNYIKKYDVEYIEINRGELIDKDKSKNPKTGKYAPHNLYINELIKVIKGGWVMILDDDDRFTNGKSLEKIVNTIPNEDTMIIWQSKFPSGVSIPSYKDINKPPKLGKIASPCVLFHSKYLGNIKWDGWKCGDFRFINTIYNKVPSKITIPETLVTVGQIGDGKKIDL